MHRFGSPDALALLGATGERADSVELKALLDPPADRVAEALTGRQAPTWSVRETYLVDTADARLLRAGVEIRLRRRTRGRYDLAVSTRRSATSCPPVDAPRGVRVEIDVVPGAVWRDVEVRSAVDATVAEQVVAGTIPAARLLSPAQRVWACQGGQEVVDHGCLAALTVHGPLEVHRVKVAATALGLRRADLEHVRFPSGVELVELSTHCRLRDVRDTAAAFERLLDEPRVAVSPEYRTKTSVWRDEIAG